MTEKRKIYTSFHDIPPREYMYFPKGTIEMGKPGKFSRIEITHLIISICVLTLAFAFTITGNSFISGFQRIINLPSGIILSFFSIVTAFIFHELAHKFMAQKFGLWAEYRMFPQGLLFALLLSVFVGFVFAAPGAVMFRGDSREFETGKIAASGPLANIIIAVFALIIYLFVLSETTFGPFFGFLCLINSVLATFNLLPFGPLDGVKIVRWNGTIWIILLIISISIMVTMFRYVPTISY